MYPGQDSHVLGQSQQIAECYLQFIFKQAEMQLLGICPVRGTSLAKGLPRNVHFIFFWSRENVLSPTWIHVMESDSGVHYTGRDNTGQIPLLLQGALIHTLFNFIQFRGLEVNREDTESAPWDLFLCVKPLKHSFWCSLWVSQKRLYFLQCHHGPESKG